MRASQLAKQHGHKLAPTGEAPRVPLGLVLLDRLFEIPARKKLQHLRKNAAYFVHRLSLLRLYWFFRNPIQPIRGSAFHSHSRFPSPPRGITQLFWTAMTSYRLSEPMPPLDRRPGIFTRLFPGALKRHERKRAATAVDFEIAHKLWL